MTLVIVVIAVYMTGCGGGNGNAKPAEGAVSTPQNGEQPANGQPVPSNQSKSPDGIELLPPVGQSLTKYMESKSAVTEKIGELIDPLTESEDAMAMLAFMPLLTADLSILPLTSLMMLQPKGDNVWEGELIALFDGHGHIEQKGDISTFQLEMTTKDGTNQKQTITGEYDAKKDSLKAIYTTEGKEVAVFEYAASGDGYVSQLLLEENGAKSLNKSAFDNSKAYLGMVSASGGLSSIYQQDIKISEDFVKNDDLKVVIEGDNGYVIAGGKKIGGN